MILQRTIGIDLAIKGNHVAAGCDAQGTFIRKKPFRFDQTLEGFESLIETFIEPDTQSENIHFIMEATSNVWIPISSYLISRGFRVYTVKTQKVSDLRKFLKKYTKSDFNDAKALARQPFVDDTEQMNQLVLPSRDIYTLKRLVKQYASYGDDIARYKTKIHSIFQMINPKLIDCLADHKFTQGAIYFYKNFSNPFKIKEIGRSNFKKRMLKNIHGNSSTDVIDPIYEASIEYCHLLEEIKDPCFDLDALQDEIKRELKHIQFLENERKDIKNKIDALYQQLDPDNVLLDFQGVGTLIAPVILSVIGNFNKFSSINKIKAYLGFVPRKKQSSNNDRKGLKITKNGQNIFKEHIYLAANVARQWDVEFAHKYNILINKGKHHNQAICALGNMLISRIYSIMRRREQALASGNLLLAQTIRYRLRDLQGNEITKAEARKIILRNYPSKQEKQKKEKAPLVFSARQLKSSSKNRKENLSPKATNRILADV